MEKTRGRKKLRNADKVSTIVDPTSLTLSVTPVLFQGNQLSGGKENDLPRLSPLSTSSSDLSYFSCSGTLEGHKGVFEVGRGGSKGQLGGNSMKKLLADEMSKETVSGRRSPSVIANLMGLDWLPVQEQGNKPNKQHSETRQLKSPCVDVGRSGKMYDNRLHRKHGKGEQRVVKDVRDVVERYSTDVGSNTSRAASFRSASEEEVAFVRQKFMDVKRFSTDEKLQQSKEYQEALEVLDSNKDLLLKFLQEPNPLFAKHLHHLHGARESPCGGRSIKSSHTLKCNVDVIGCHSGEAASKKIDISHSRKYLDKCQCNLHSRQNFDRHKTIFTVEGEEDATSVPTRIVLLKPNLGKARNSARSASSTATSCNLASNNELHNGCPGNMHPGSEIVGKRSKRDDLDVFVKKSRESRELAREVTRRMRNKLGVDSFSVPSSGYKGYSADESSCDLSENDSSFESEVAILGPTTSLNRGIYKKSPASRFMESPINREAKRRLSSRWKMTHKSEDVGSSSKGSTLAEMLAIPDVDIRPQNPGSEIGQDQCRPRHRRDGGATELISPLGISSRDGWKDFCIRNLPRSRSLPASPSYLGSPKSSTWNDENGAEKFLMHKSSCGHGCIRPSRRNSDRKWGSFSESTRSSNKEYWPTFVEMTDIQGNISDVSMVKTTIDVKDSPEVKSVIQEMPSCQPDTSLPLNTLGDIALTRVCDSSNCHDEVTPAPRIQSRVLPHDDRSNCDVSSVQQEPSRSYDAGDSFSMQSQSTVTQPESPLSSKECEQPSPVSVLEAPFVEELSSGSDCFERVSEGLHGLRMQLQLLKQESEAYDEGSVLISSDEDGEESTELDDGESFYCTEESWESSYLVDVLSDSRIDETFCTMFFGAWYSPDCPIGLWVFENLENKYGRWQSCLRSERRLLFDRVNAGIVHMCLQYVDAEQWLKPLVKNITAQWWKEGLKMKLQSLLENHGKVTENGMNSVILEEMQWLKHGDHIGAVGSDIERLIIDELIAELLPL